MMMKIELNEQFKKVLDMMEKGDKPVFVTGRAGTGKSTLLEYFREHTKKDIVVLAPTGVAALNVKGQTIHSFFGFSTDITLESVKKPRKNIKTMRALDTLVIDEISMVRADLLDCMDRALRLARGKKDKPFGGVRLVGIGDLYQLPPVVASAEERLFFKTRYQSPYFFASDVFQTIDAEMFELEKIYRQSDKKFIEILNAVRNNSVEDHHIHMINSRLDPDFLPPRDSFFVTLTPTNAMAQEQNQEWLERLMTPRHRYEAEVEGAFERNSYPTDSVLILKKGAQVMMVNNDRLKRWVNGTIARVEGFREGGSGWDEVLVRLPNGKRVSVDPYTWEMFRFSYDAEKQSITSQSAGSFRQYPMMLSWAVTIHKSQGKTFDQVAIDIGRGTFAHGQMYVALSRSRTLEGIVLKRPIEKRHIFMDFAVVEFLTQFQYGKAEELLPLNEKVQLLREGVEQSKLFKILYLKANDEKSTRIITPKRVANMIYKDKTFLGVDADDTQSGERRVFRIDRILEMKEISEEEA